MNKLGLGGDGFEKLSLAINAYEKITSLPDEVLSRNGLLREEIQKSWSAHNIDAMLNTFTREIQDERNIRRQQPPQMTQDQLLFAYAARENDRVSRASQNVRSYITEIINEEHAKDANQPLTTVAMNASSEADEAFKTAFNSVYSDGAVKINTMSDPTTLMSYIDYSPYRVNYAEYLSVPTLSELVDRPLAIALKKFPEITSKNEKFNKEIIKQLNKKKIKNVIKDALFYSLLSPRGSLVVPIKRGETVTFNVFNDTQFAYGMGSSYSGVTQHYDPMKVGELYCMGAKLKHGVSAFFTCPGYEPLFGVGLNRLPQLRTAAETWNIYIHIVKYLLVRAQMLVQNMNGDIQTDTKLAQMRNQLQKANQKWGISTPIEQAQGMTLDILSSNITPGTSDIAEVIQDFVASITGCSPEYFFGGGSATYSQAAFQIHVTNENIRSRYQVNEIEPLLRFIVNTFIREDSTISALGVTEDDFEIEFENIYDETEQEAAELIAKKTETLIRQASYPELEKAFKQEGLLSDDITLPELAEPNTGDKTGDGEKSGSVLTKPLG